MKKREQINFFYSIARVVRGVLYFRLAVRRDEPPINKIVHECLKIVFLSVLVVFFYVYPPQTDADLLTWQHIKEHGNDMAKTTKQNKQMKGCMVKFYFFNAV